ncbi:hypothetical protein MWU50_07460 [Flavobacteriaceae bacterium S0862]|nr:hypothetical protein [Flavobacteriaceae bacterium S0862]
MKKRNLSMKWLYVLKKTKNLLWKLMLVMLFIITPISLTGYFYLYEETSFGMALGQGLLLTFFGFVLLAFLHISISFIINSFNKDPLIREESQDGIIGFVLVLILPIIWIILSQLDFISPSSKINIGLGLLFLFIVIFFGYVFYKTINDPMVNRQKAIKQLLISLGIVVLIGLIAIVIFVFT